MSDIFEKYPLLKGFKQVSEEEFAIEFFGSYENIELYFVANDNNQITHLSIDGGEEQSTQSNWFKNIAPTIDEYIEKLIDLLISQGCGQTLIQLAIKSLSVSALPKSLGKLKSLIALNIFECQLTTLPQSMGGLKNLKILIVEDNQLNALPENLGELKSLTELAVNYNQLTALPKNLGELKSLTELDASNNQLTALPTSASKLQNLQRFFVNNNPINKNIHQLANKLDPQSKISYLLEIQKPETCQLKEAKVLVLGDERVGKTSLINRIFGRDMDENQQTTLGIDIERFKLKNDITINIWDFAGQEIAHQTHQFFLSHRSLYLLVLDGQKQDNDADISKWLNTIKSTAGSDAPIVVVVNKCDLSPGQFDLHRYKQDFNIVDVIYTSAADETTFDEQKARQVQHSVSDLIDVIEQHVADIDEVYLPFPPSWLAVKQDLEAKQQQNIDFIESTQYEGICDKHGLSDERWQDALLTILNQIGTVVTYKDDERLHSMQIINPVWVTNGVYKVLRSDLIKDSEATVNQSQFKEIFAGDKKYSKKRHYLWLIDLLKQFRLAFSISSAASIGGEDERILLPARLGTTQPDFDIKKYRQGLNFRFLYEGLLKPSIISQFIVYMHEYITQDEVKYWKRGVFLTYQCSGGANTSSSSADAVVISDEEQKTITIAVNNANRAGRDLLTIIRHAIRTINGPEVEVDEQVPLLIDGELVGFKSYDEIIEAEEDGDENIRAGIKGQDKKSLKFKVRELLDGYRIQDPTFDYSKLTEDLFKISGLLTESRKAIMAEDEDSTNDRFKTALLAMNYRVADQSRGGESLKGLRAGERDLVVRNSQTNIVEAVIEAVVLKGHDATVINKHLEKLIEHYDTTGNKHNYMLVYVKSERFFELWDKYKSLIDDCDDTSDEHGKRFVLTGRSTHGIRHFKTTVNHIFIGFNPDLEA